MKVLLATPAYGGQVTEPYLQSIINLIHSSHAKGIQVDVMTLSNESLITRARNEVVATFMGGDWTDLLWVDADISFSPEHAWKLLESPHEVCATPYAMKGLDWNKAWVADSPDAARRAASISVINNLPGSRVENGFVTALDAGTGFMRVKRSALEKLIAAHPETKYETEKAVPDKTRWALFDCAIVDGRYLSEDYLFCHRWRELGGTVYADVASARLGHMGSYIYGK
jgi:hypothetical protein